MTPDTVFSFRRQVSSFVPLVIGAVLVVVGLFIGFSQVGGHFDNESFDCGAPLRVADGDSGYEGSEQYRACDQERVHLRAVAWGSLGLGSIALVASAFSAPAPAGAGRHSGHHTSNT